jgi:cell division protein FtsQ
MLVATFWIVAGTGTIVLLVAAMNKKNSMRCKSVEVTITGVQNNYFVNEDDVKTIIRHINGGKLEGVEVSKFNLQMMEAALKKNIWIRDAELFFDNNEHLKVDIDEREPVARIFTDKGTSFYIDSSRRLLPLSNKASARIPVFTGFVETRTITRADSLLFKDVAILGEYILNDPFWMAQIEQIDIQPGRQFEMVPKVGNHIIAFGTVADHEQKFRKLLKFYKTVLAKAGWSKYSKINVQYAGQVIGVKRAAAEITADSLRTIQIMNAIVLNTQARANDSLGNIQMSAEEQPGIDQIQSSERNDFESDDSAPVPTQNIVPSQENITAPVTSTLKPNTEIKTTRLPVEKKIQAPAVRPASKPASNTSATKQTTTKAAVKKEVKKPEVKKPVDTKQRQKQTPKAVMPPNNDY